MHNKLLSKKKESAAQEIMQALGKDMTIKTRLVFLLIGFAGLFAPEFTFVFIVKSFATALKNTISDQDQLNELVSFFAGDTND
jgi:hypothetical protein